MMVLILWITFTIKRFLLFYFSFKMKVKNHAYVFLAFRTVKDLGQPFKILRMTFGSFLPGL